MKAFMFPVLCLALASCVSSVTAVPTRSQETAVRTAVQNTARNPASVTTRNFRSYTLSNGETATCVDVNAENAFGGMTGFSPVVVNAAAGREPIVFWDTPAAQMECNLLARGSSARF